ncbi:MULTISPECIES: hypothetical protein [Afipia]|uniref:hypothetical protein n=1 Tax=Afipia TaxID=1033 RepID=UPI0003172D72|nr:MULTISPECIES: hypothetical protein [Afipia]
MTFEQTIEVQLPTIDAKDELDDIDFSDLTRAELAKMPALESGWSNSPASQVVSFLRETREALEDHVSQAGWHQTLGGLAESDQHRSDISAERC